MVRITTYNCWSIQFFLSLHSISFWFYALFLARQTQKHCILCAYFILILVVWAYTRKLLFHAHKSLKSWAQENNIFSYAQNTPLKCYFQVNSSRIWAQQDKIFAYAQNLMLKQFKLINLHYTNSAILDTPTYISDILNHVE